MYSDLELLIMGNMIDLGFDPLSEEEIKLYWERLLR